MNRPILICALFALAACSKQPAGETAKGDLPDNVTAATEVVPDSETMAPAAPASADAAAGLKGRWTGPEGLFLTIADGGEPGSYDLVVKGDLDSKGDPFEGRADGDTIVFTRNGKQERIRKASGDETGLKWLAGKQDCVVINPGEGFCRD
ncbi:hypothetical protein ABC347_12200 [Sphingomonas sp. 1P06PA]|uniref:hypothetical protein n=1 Tax=Sphingomonas sp. 1P06PA TaxID=554121 RepID=UPI0039A77240